MIRAVLFDFGQTLADSAAGFRAAEKALQARLITHIGSPPDPTCFLERYRRMRTDFQARSVFSRNALAEAVLEAFGGKADADAVEAWEHDYWETVRRRTRLFPEARIVLHRLAKSFSLGLVTNAQAGRDGHRVHDRPRFLNRFQAVVVAGEDRIPFKPDPQPFRICLETLGVSAGEAVFVGDDVRIDVEGARNAGLHPVWLRRRGRKHALAPPPAVPVITTLTALPNVPILRNASREEP